MYYCCYLCLYAGRPCRTSLAHQCADGHSCISKWLVCDGNIDCPDGSDEDNSLCGASPTSVIHPGTLSKISILLSCTLSNLLQSVQSHLMQLHPLYRTTYACVGNCSTGLCKYYVQNVLAGYNCYSSLAITACT